MTALVRVTIVEDQQDIREGLRFLIDSAPGYACTGAFASMEDALPAISPAATDVVLVDLVLPGMSGIEGIRILGDRHHQLRLVVLTVYEDDDRIFEALCAGAAGYVLKTTPPARLLGFLDEVMNGGAPMSPQVASRVVALFREFSPPRHSDYRLTPHEVRILNLLGEGHNYKTSAAAEEHRQHRGIPYEEHLSKAAGALQIRGGRQGSPPPHRALTVPRQSKLPKQGLSWEQRRAKVAIVKERPVAHRGLTRQISSREGEGMTRPNSAAAVIATLLTLHVAACRNEPAAPAPGAPAAAQPAAPASQPAQPAAPASQPTQPPATAPQPTAPLPTQPAQAAAQPTASLASADSEQPGLRVEIQELKRTEGGTVTLKLAFINTGGRNIFNLGGFDEINLIDAVGKKKYFVAEDSAGTCLCSGSLVNFETDARANVWAKFPAPPEDVQKIAVVVPKFPPIEGIPISR